MIDRIQNYYESSTIGKIIVLSSLIVPFGAFALFVFSKKNIANKEEKVIDESHLVIYEKDTTFNKKRDGYYTKNATERKKIERSEDFFDYSKDIKKIKENLSNNNITDSIYDEGQDPRFAEMERKIQEMTKQNTVSSNSYSRSQNASNSVSRSTNKNTNPYYKKKTKVLSYEEKLALAKKKRLESITDYGYNNSKSTVSFDVIIFEDQWKLPGQRLRMVLPKETKINGKVFKKGTAVYATVNIQESRVFLNINNINGVSMKLEAYDPDDHERGLYSQRAGELWKEYQNQTTQNTQSAISNEVSRKLNIPVVGSAMSDMVAYFSKKRRRDDEKLLFLNDHRIILKLSKK